MTSKMIELLLSLSGILDEFLEKIAETVVYGDGVGGEALGTFNLLTKVVLLFLGVAFLWNVGEAVLERARHGASSEHAIPWPQFKKCLHIFLIAMLVTAASATLGRNPKGGNFMGLNYGGVISGLTTSSMKAAMNTLGAVDIVVNWGLCLQEFDADRRERIIQAIAAKDPKAAETYAARLAYVSDPARAPLSVVEKVKTAWSAGKAAAGGQANTLLSRFVVNMLLYGLIFIVITFCTLVFIYQAGRTILLLAFYVKLSALLTMALVPIAIGVLYFERLRHYGTQVLKQLVVLSLVAGILGTAVQTVFSNTLIKQAIVTTMKGELAPYIKAVTDEDISRLETATDIEVMLTMAGASHVMLPDFAGTMSVGQVLGSIAAVIKIMFLLGTMLMIISRLFDLVTEILGGYWDPFAEGSRAAG